MDKHLEVGSVTVRLRAEEEAVLPVLDGVSRYLHAVENVGHGAPDLQLDIVQFDIEGEPAAAGLPPDATALGTFDNGFALWRSGSLVVLEGGACSAELDVRQGRGVVRVGLDQNVSDLRWVACAVVVESLAILLHRHGLFTMHAAAVAREGRGLVVAAAADSGKSTLTLRLVQRGWDYLSDDTVLLRPDPKGVEVLGMRAHFSLDPDAEALFPGLSAGREASLLKEEKWAVNVEALHPDRRAEVCRPAVLVFPHIVDAPKSTLVPVSKPEAFGALLAQSSLARVKLDYVAEHLDTLGRLAADTLGYRLYAGRDLLSDPDRADALLAPLLSATFQSQ